MPWYGKAEFRQLALLAELVTYLLPRNLPNFEELGNIESRL
jgi:hypothetical protein